MIKIGGSSINRGYFSGKYVLRIWDVHGDTLHSSTHDLPRHAEAELENFREKLRGENGKDFLTDLPTATNTSATGKPTPIDE